jgi:recombination DNA repair RAD52 pathway protein
MGLSLSTGKENGQTDLANRSGRFCPETPQNTSETKIAPTHDKSLSSFEQEKPSLDRDPLAQKPFTTAHRAKPVRPVWETGQAGFAWTVGKNTARGKNSTFQLVPQIKVRLLG